MPIAAKTRAPPVPRSTRMTVPGGRAIPGVGSASVISVARPRKEAVGTQHEGGQEGAGPRQDLPFRLERGADRLRDPEDDRAGERPPQAAEAADDDRLEGEDQPSR